MVVVGRFAVDATAFAVAPAAVVQAKAGRTVGEINVVAAVQEKVG